MKVISISNIKGGVAKTTTAATLAAGLNKRGYKVLMIDSDPQMNLTMCFTHEPEEGTPQIKGENQVYPYDSKEFVVENATGGTWLVDSNKVNIVAQTDSTVKVNVVTGKSGKFILSYKNDNDEEIAMKEIKILSL